MKRIAILGSTGSIGCNALKVVRRFPGRFRVEALSASSNIELLGRQIQEFRPRLVCVRDGNLAVRLKVTGVRILAGEEGLEELVKAPSVDHVLIAISGSAALTPLLEAIERGKEIALANKEALVMAGPLIVERARRKGVSIIPIDSEQSAIWQCLQGEDRKKLRRIYLTASGGPFRGFNRRDLRGVSVARVLRHPRWKMGRKISVDSATLMNKGFELLEAVYLFGVEPSAVKVIIHPEAIIHSMVEFVDGILLAQLSVTDMRLPIQYALSFPERLTNTLQRLDFFRLKRLRFEKPDFATFPCLGFAYRAAAAGGIAPAVLNAADEIAVEAFLSRRIGFLDIPDVVERTLRKACPVPQPGLSDILQADTWARGQASGIIAGLKKRK